MEVNKKNEPTAEQVEQQRLAYLEQLGVYRKQLEAVYATQKEQHPLTTGKYHEWLEDQCFRQALTVQELQMQLEELTKPKIIKP